MNERLEMLNKARARMIEERDAHVKVLAAAFDRDKTERARNKFVETLVFGRSPRPRNARIATRFANIVSLGREPCAMQDYSCLG